MKLTATQRRYLAAATTGLLLLVPLVLVRVPADTNDGFPGSLTRIDAVVGFFVAVPLVFIIFALYRVAQYHGLVGAPEDTF